MAGLKCEAVMFFQNKIKIKKYLNVCLKVQ